MKLQLIITALTLIADINAAAIDDPVTLTARSKKPNCSWAEDRSSCGLESALSKCKRNCQPSHRGARADKCVRIDNYNARCDCLPDCKDVEEPVPNAAYGRR
jgi:hypothetical protein